MGEDDDTLLLSGDMYVIIVVVHVRFHSCKVTDGEGRREDMLWHTKRGIFSYFAPAYCPTFLFLIDINEFSFVNLWVLLEFAFIQLILS